MASKLIELTGNRHDLIDVLTNLQIMAKEKNVQVMEKKPERIPVIGEPIP